MTEHTVDWRWARLVLGQGSGPGPPPRTRRSATSPVSTTKSRVAAAGEADGHAERDVAGRRCHRKGHRRPVLALRQRGRDGPCGPVNGDDCDQRAPLGARAGPARPAAKSMRMRAEAGEHVGAEQADRLALPAHLGQRGGRQLLRRQGNPSSDQDPTETGRAVPVQPTPANSRRRTGAGQTQPVGQAGVDGRLPRPRVEDERVRPLAADAHVGRLGHLPGHHAHRQRHLLARRRAAPWRRRSRVPAGGRANVTSGSTWTVRLRMMAAR